MKLEGLRQIIKEELAKALNENTFKVGDTVIPNKGPHKGIPHEVIAVLDGGAYNIKPKNLKASEIKYKLGAARATQSDLESGSLNEDTFHNGEEVLHMGQRFTVVKDSGNVGVEVQTKDGKIKMINRGQLTKVVKEEMQINRGKLADLLKANDMGENDNFIRTGNPSQKFLQDLISKLEAKGVSTVDIYAEKSEVLPTDEKSWRDIKKADMEDYKRKKISRD